MGRKKVVATEPEPVEQVLGEVLEQTAALQEQPLLDTGVDESPDDSPKTPRMYDPDWTAWVLSKLTPDEQWDGKPKVEGLRRFTREYVGDVVESTTRPVQAPNPQNGNHACFIHDLVVVSYEDNISRRYSGTADVFEGNGDDPNFTYKYSSPSCETRAESRAYRRALLLRVCTAEEISKPASGSFVEATNINARQKAFFDMVCKRLDVNVMAFVNSGKRKYASIDDVPYSKAVEMQAHLTVMQQKRNEILPSIKGYDPNWQTA